MTAVERIPGKFERLARERSARDHALAAQPGGHPKGYVYDAAEAERPIKFLESLCRHHKGKWAGQPLLLEGWQKHDLREAFGWKRADGSRRFRTVYQEVPRKNGKSEIAGGLGLFLEGADGEAGAEVYSAATKLDQARIVWETAREMIARSPDLRRNFRTYQASIVKSSDTASFFKPLGADSKSLDGLNPHGVIVDELHAHKNRKVWDVLQSALGAREQPMTFVITTAGEFDPESIGWEKHEYAGHVLEGTIDDDTFYAVIYAADPPPEGLTPDENAGYYYRESVQRQANPNYGVSVKPDYLAERAAEARVLPSAEPEYLTKHLNVWTQTTSRWLRLDRWAACEPAPVDRAEREASLLGKLCHGGLDLADRLDLNALALAFPDGEFVDLILRFWLPEATFRDYVKRNQAHWLQWKEAGWLTVTPGNVVDHQFIRAELVALSKIYSVQTVGFDPWGALQLSIDLDQSDGIKMVETRQGFATLSEPSKDLEARIMNGKIRHANNPVLRFCAANAVVVKDPAGNIKPDKSSKNGKIDGIVASIMALARANLEPKPVADPYANGAGFRQL